MVPSWRTYLTQYRSPVSLPTRRALLRSLAVIVDGRRRAPRRRGTEKRAVAAGGVEDTGARKLAHHGEDQALLERLGNGAERRGALEHISFRPAGRGRVRLAHASARFSWWTTSPISSCVVLRPRLKRMAPMPTSGAIPMACSTGESAI